MRNMLRETIKIREKGQMTIPIGFREAASWLGEETVVDVILKPAEEKMELYPFKPLKKRVPASGKETTALWRRMRKIGRSGRDINLSDFVIRDRKYGHASG